MISFAQWLLQHRTAVEMTQRDVAELAGCDRAYITLLEGGGFHNKTGKRIKPRPETIMSIAMAVGGDIDEALHLSGSIPARPFGFFLDHTQNIRVTIFNPNDHSAIALLRIKKALLTACKNVESVP